MAIADDRLKTANDGGYNNLLVVVLALVAVYLLVSGFTKSKKQAYLDSAGTDKTTQQAQGLRDAINRSGVKLLMDVDGTDVDLVMQIAAQIQDYPAVSDSYRVIYGSELTNDLQTELSRTDLQKFYDIVYKRTSTSSTPTTPGGPAITTVRKVTALQTVNIRDYTNPQTQLRQAQKGEYLGVYDGETTLTVNGSREIYVAVKTDHWLNGFYDVKIYVWKKAVSIK